VIGEKYGEFFDESVPRSEPQMPESSGLTLTHSGAGSLGSGISSSRRGENRLVSRFFMRLAAARISR
jgi:hypothetical protein